MDVHLLVYDLSQGLARQLSQGLLGFHLDAVYHTSIELNGSEYVYDGGIVSIVPGSSHLGKPMERIFLGRTDLPMDVIQEYIESLRSIFTFEAYDLFRHNCNNFSDSLAKFLLGKGIPSHISEMPQKVLASPMGSMLFSQLTQSVNAGRQNGSILGIESTGQVNGTPAGAAPTQQPQALRHPHQSLDVPTFKDTSSTKFIEFAKIPPMEKVLAKLGDAAKHETVLEIRNFIDARAQDGAADATVPDFKNLSEFVQKTLKSLPKDALFPLVDIFRCILTDARISGYFAENPDTISSVIGLVTSVDDAPYALRLVTLQMACNLFSTPLFTGTTLHSPDFRSQLTQLITSSLLDTQHTPTRVAAASLIFNLALADQRARETPSQGQMHMPFLQDGDQLELAASVVEAVSGEVESAEALRALLTALGRLVFLREREGELAELLRAVEAKNSVAKKKGEKIAGEMGRLVGEVEALLKTLEE